jgi:hypothetical protein
MFASDDLERIIKEVDVLVAELREWNENGSHFRILHRFHAPGSDCASGEEVAGVYLVHRGREYFLRLPLALRLLFDYLHATPICRKVLRRLRRKSVATHSTQNTLPTSWDLRTSHEAFHARTSGCISND